VLVILLYIVLVKILLEVERIQCHEERNHPKYKGGHIDIFGYRVIWVNSKPIREHRHLMEQYIGRKLKRCEYVHHKDEDPLNNNLNNLEVISAKDHTILHHKGKQSPLKGRKYPIGHYSKRVCVKV